MPFRLAVVFFPSNYVVWWVHSHVVRSLKLMWPFRGAILALKFRPFHSGLKYFSRLCCHSFIQQLFTKCPLCSRPWAVTMKHKRQGPSLLELPLWRRGNPALKVSAQTRACIHQYKYYTQETEQVPWKTVPLLGGTVGLRHMQSSLQVLFVRTETEKPLLHLSVIQMYSIIAYCS